jgi:hypothetical protein
MAGSAMGDHDTYADCGRKRAVQPSAPPRQEPSKAGVAR